MPSNKECCCCMTYRQGAIAIIVYDLVTALLALIPSYSIFTWKMLYMIPGFISVLNKFVKKSRLMHFIWRSIMDGVSFSLFFIVVMAIELEFGFRENRLYFVAVIVSLCMNIYFDTMLYNFWESKQPNDQQIMSMSQPSQQLQNNNFNVVQGRVIQDQNEVQRLQEQQMQQQQTA